MEISKNRRLFWLARNIDRARQRSVTEHAHFQTKNNEHRQSPLCCS